MPDKDLQEGQDPSQQDPADGGDGNPQGDGADPSGEQDVEALPEWAKKRLQGAEGALSDLKQTAGAKSVKELKDRLVKKPDAAPAPKPKAPEKKGDDPGYVTREELAALQQGFTAEEISVAQRIAPGKPLADALQDPVAKAAINGIRTERRTNEQIPEPTSRIPVVGKKAFNDLKPDEKKANYGKSVEALIQKGRQRGGRNVGS